MKRIFLPLLLIPFGVFSQAFDQNNEPTIGALSSLHLCDSNANVLANTNGNNATWDFSQIAGIFGVTKDVQMLDASLDPNFASFAGATKLYDIGGNFQTFFSSDANGRVSQGFVFNEVSLGAVVASWSTDQENLMTYPFNFGNNITDIFSGTVTTTATGTIPATGSSMAAVDGTGTLLLPGGNTYSNVSRYHLKDSAVATVFGTNVAFVREVFEYYDFTVSNLPIFITMSVDVNSPLIVNSSTIILSKDQPTTFVGINENSTDSFVLYPNPSNGLIQFSKDLNGASYRVLDAAGRTIQSGTANSSLDVTKLQSGVYFLSVNNQVIEFHIQ